MCVPKTSVVVIVVRGLSSVFFFGFCLSLVCVCGDAGVTAANSQIYRLYDLKGGSNQVFKHFLSNRLATDFLFSKLLDF